MSVDFERPARLGVILPAFPHGDPPPGFYVDMPRLIEELGFDAYYCGDHMFGHTGNPEPLTLLAGAAAVTSRIRIGTNILIAALREPALAAKQIATIDVLSGGRMVVGVGVGGEMPDEWQAMEVPLARRGARTDDYLDLMQALWSGKLVNHGSEFRTLRGVVGSPSPVQPGGPPILVGGRSDAAIRRALRHDGWYAYASSPRSVAARVAELRAARGDAFTTGALVFYRVDDTHERAIERANSVILDMYQQDFSGLFDHISVVGDPDEVRARLTAYARTGIDELVLCPLAPAEEIAPTLEAAASVFELSNNRYLDL